MKAQPSSLERGFSLVDTLVVVSLVGVISAIAVPTLINGLENLKLGQSTRNVERELQTAKMRAVGKGRAIRVRFNCPEAGQFRIVELLGTTTTPSDLDNSTDRCSETIYPHPPADTNPLTLPNLDGPVRRLDSSVSFTEAQTIEFWPDGTAHYDDGSSGQWPLIPVAGINVSMYRNGKTSTITVNGLGKVQLQSSYPAASPSGQ